MLRAVRSLLFASACSAFVALPAQADPGGKSVPEAPAPLDPTTLRALEQLSEQLAAKRTQRLAALAAGDAATAATLDAELRSLGWQFGGLASRLDVQQFEAPQERSFDIKAELEELMRPVVQALKDATEEPRQISELRGRIQALQARQRTAEAGLRAAERTRDALPPLAAARAETQREIDQRWRPAISAMRGEIVVLEARLLARRQAQQSILTTASQGIQGFVQNSGLNLLLCAAVFLSVLFTVRWLQNRLLQRRLASRALSLRLFEVALQAIGILLAVGATIIVPYARNDWVLLAIGIVFLFGTGWIAVRMLPQFFEQIRLVLNVGGVREGERIEIDGLPYRVDQLRFYSSLDNPDLQGGALRVPIQQLVGKRSRPAGPHEQWFPSRVGDFVTLADGVFGEVLQQSPDCVVVRSLGGARSYTTPAYMAQNPRNLSRGFVVDTTFGIDYRHQADATTTVPKRMREALQRGLGAMLPAGQLLRTDVQFAAAGSSSLDYLVLAEFTGEAAARFAELRRALQRILVDACNEHGWTIPFPQMVVHRPAC